MEEDVTPMVEWARTGNQKGAMLQVLTRPMPAKSILHRAKKISPRITYRDLVSLLQGAQKMEVVTCLTPKRDWGKIYYLTPLGQQTVHQAFGIHTPLLPTIDWDAFAYAQYGATRFNVFLNLTGHNQRPRRATDIKRALRGEQGLTLNQTSRALAELELEGLVRIHSISLRRSSRLYAYTEKGQEIMDMLHYFDARDPFSFTEKR